MKNKLFTIVLTNYNQEKFIFEAIDSIINQSYKNLELIITDDCSKKFEKEKIAKYIKNNSNIDCKFVINEQNLGTVKTLNKALKIANGEYVLFFAADDVLKNKDVVKNYVKAFKNHPRTKIISAISLIYDENLIKVMDKFPNDNKIKTFNKLSSQMQNQELMFGPVFAPGATVYKKELFDEIGYLDEKYILIEDWSLFLKLTRLGYKILIADFCSLKHRGGGVSETKKLSKKTIDNIIYDSDLIYKSEIFPYIKKFNTEEKLKILERYQRFGYTYGIRYKSIYNKYYWLIFSNFDVLKYKIFNSPRISKILEHIFLPLISILFVSILYLFIKKDSILILGSVISYIILKKINNFHKLGRS